MKLTECPSCHAPVRLAVVVDESDDTVAETLLDPSPSLHGSVRVVDLATGDARLGPRRPGQYRPHYETCRGAS